MNEDHATGDIDGVEVSRGRKVPSCAMAEKFGIFPSDMNFWQTSGSIPSMPTMTARLTLARARTLRVAKDRHATRMGITARAANTARKAPKRTMKEAKPASPAEAAEYLRTQRQRERALYGQQCAEEANYIWQMVEDELVEKARYLRARLRNISHDLMHVQAMLQEISINPFTYQEEEEEGSN